MNENQTTTTQTTELKTKFCKHCGEKIDAEAVLCIKCGKQVEELKYTQNEQPKIDVNVNQNQSSVNTNTIHVGMLKPPKNKWVSLALCLFIGYFGAHKFYEGKNLMGIIYIFTFGLAGIGILIDFIILLLKPNPYYI